MEYHGKKFTFDAEVLLGHGGMADVYLGRQRDAQDVYAAIKVPLQGLDDNVKDLFFREAEAAQRVSGPHVVKVLDWGNEPPFIAFEYIPQGTLAEELRSRRDDRRLWAEEELISQYRQLALALSAINKEVIHRDLKPENIFLEGNLLRVSDFGISKYVGEVTRTKTFKGWGTPQYMAPETFRGESVDWRADQYALGVIFYEMATLELPFVGDWPKLEELHLFHRPKRISQLVSDLSERLATCVSRMLEKQPQKRFQSWDDLIDELDDLGIKNFASDEGGPAPTLIAVAAQHLEEIRRKELDHQRLIEEQNEQKKCRLRLLDYWGNHFQEGIRKWVDKFDEQLGRGTIHFEQKDQQSSRIWQVSFINSELSLHLQVTPLDAKDILLWGGLCLATYKHFSVANFLLLQAPPPYGTWREVSMRVSGIMRGGYEPDDDVGGKYRLLGRDQLVLALNWPALNYQRRMMHVISGINYREEDLSFDQTLGGVMQMLVEDAGATAPEGYQHRRIEWG